MDTDTAYDYLIEAGIATEDEISLVTTINGENLETYESILFARTVYRNFGQLEDD